MQDFVFRFLQSKQEWIYVELRQGAAQPHVYASDIAKMEIRIPPLQEQRGIVTVLDEALATIATATSNAEKNLANARTLFSTHREQLLQNASENWAERSLSELCTIRCLIPGFDGALFTSEWKDALWARYSTGAPRRQRQSVERYSIVKRA